MCDDNPADSPPSRELARKGRFGKWRRELVVEVNVEYVRTIIIRGSIPAAKIKSVAPCIEEAEIALFIQRVRVGVGRANHKAVRQSLLNMGLKPGDEVAYLGHTTIPYYWAHVSQLRVTGDIQIDDLYAYWMATPQKRAEIAARFRENGIKALVVIGPPLAADKWQAIGDSGYYVEFLGGGAARSEAAPASK